MEETKRFLANPVVSCADEKDGSVLFNPDTDDMAVINPTGRLIWDFIPTAKGIDEIAVHLVESYPDLESAQAAEDAQAFVDQLLGDFVLEEQAEDDN